MAQADAAEQRSAKHLKRFFRFKADASRAAVKAIDTSMSEEGVVTSDVNDVAARFAGN
jgi:hypothetical protein